MMAAPPRPEPGLRRTTGRSASMVERERARFGAWYEMFPRSSSPEPGRHGTFRDDRGAAPLRRGDGVRRPLPAADPPDRPGLPQGAEQHADPRPRRPRQPLGDRRPRGRAQGRPPRAGDARRLRPPGRRRRRSSAWRSRSTSPSSARRTTPTSSEHPQWFRHRPDGTIKYAENPPKKYQDIYPIDFECDDWEALWAELRDVFLFWVGHGVTIFRVDNPHTKPFRFWDWVIREVWDRHPEAIFLAEAFTRPKIMRRLAKGGYPQSYSYFTWRNTKRAIEEYFTELTQDRRRRVHAAQPVRQHARTSSTSSSRSAAGPRSRSAWSWPRPWGRPTGSTARRSSSASARPGSPARRSTSTPRSTRSATGTSTGPATSATSSPGSTPSAARTPRSTHDRNLRFFPTDNDQMIAYGKATPDRLEHRSSSSSTSTRTTSSRAGSALPLDELGLGAGQAVVPGPRPDRRRPIPLARRVELRPARPPRLPRPHLPGPAEGQDRAGFRLLTCDGAGPRPASPGAIAPIDGGVREAAAGLGRAARTRGRRAHGLERARPPAVPARGSAGSPARPATLGLGPARRRDGARASCPARPGWPCSRCLRDGPSPRRYFLPLGLADGAEADRLGREAPGRVIARVDGPDGLASFRRPGRAGRLRGPARRDRRRAGRSRPARATIRGVPTPSFDAARGPADRPLPVIRGTVEQSNSAVLFGDRLILKVFRRLEPGINPDFEIGRFLSEKTRFDRIPRTAGALEYDRPGRRADDAGDPPGAGPQPGDRLGPRPPRA